MLTLMLLLAGTCDPDSVGGTQVVTQRTNQRRAWGGGDQSQPGTDGAGDVTL